MRATSTDTIKMLFVAPTRHRHELSPVSPKAVPAHGTHVQVVTSRINRYRTADEDALVQRIAVHGPAKFDKMYTGNRSAQLTTTSGVSSESSGRRTVFGSV